MMTEGGTYPSEGKEGITKGDAAPDLACARSSGPYWRNQVCPVTRTRSLYPVSPCPKSRRSCLPATSASPGSAIRFSASPWLPTARGGLFPFRGGELPAARPLPRGAGRALHDAHPDEGRGRLVGSRGGKPDHPRYGIRVTEIATKPWHMKECSPYDLSNVL